MDLSGELARTLLDLAPDPTVIVDADGTIVFVNAQVEHAFGYGATELVGARVEALLPERFRERIRVTVSASPRMRSRARWAPAARSTAATRTATNSQSRSA